MSVKTVRPHSLPAPAPTGALKVTYWTPVAEGLRKSVGMVVLEIQGRARAVFTDSKVCLPWVTGSLPRTVDAWTFTSQSAKAAPLGNEVSTSVANWSGRSGSWFMNPPTPGTKLPIVSQGGGPNWIQTSCQCEANTRPPLSA